MKPIDLSLLPSSTEVDDNGRLRIGGVDLLKLAETVGTPAFVYDEKDLRNRFDTAYSIFGDGVAYATKAFLCQAVARLAYDSGLSLDVATGGEYHVCRMAGVPASKLVVHGNNKHRSYVERAVSEGAQWIVLDSMDDITQAEDVAKSLGRRARVLIRVNPGVEVHTHRFNKTGGRRSKFGLPMWTGDADRALKLVKNSAWLDLVGVHMHVGSLVFSTETFVAAVKSVIDFVEQADAEVFVVGGGLGVRYLNEDDAPSMHDWADAVFSFCRSRKVKSRVLAEPGRALVAPAAVTLYRVGSVATKGEDTYYAVDGGMSDNPRPLLYESGYELFSVREPEATRDRLVTLVGSHCESGDTIVRGGYLPATTSVDDIVSTPVTGAYGYSMASNYNKMPRPPIVFVSDGRARVVVRRETYEDLLACDIGTDAEVLAI